MQKVFEPRPRFPGVRGTAGEITRELSQARWLIWQLLRRDLLVGHKQYLGGILWAFLVPLMGLALLLILQRSGVFSSGQMKVPYPLYALCGMALWQLFALGVAAATNSLTAAAGLISRIDFCRKALVLASIGQAAFPFFLQLAALLVVMPVSGISPAGLPAFLLLSLPLALLALGAGFFFAIFNAVSRDMGQLVAIGVNLFLLVTPVVYAIPREGLLARVSRYNLFFYLIQVPRDILFSGQSALWMGYALSGMCAVCVFGAGLVFFHLAERKVAERI